MFEVTQTSIEGLVIINSFLAEDCRGYYKKYFERNIFKTLGLPTDFSESSDILSNCGVMRGLHYQTECSQGKLLHVIAGRIFDVALDLRESSETFGKYEVFVLNGVDNKAVYIPEGFAHGFMALEDNTYFSYQCTGKYIQEACGGIRWDSPELAIPWPIKNNIIMTDKDRNWPDFSEYCKISR